MSPEFIKAEMALFAAQAKDVDIIITTALVPGKAAPKLITAETAASMRAGSVIVDLAAEQGGNCELTVPGEVVKRHGVTIIGYTDLPSRLAAQASQLYATNLRHLLDDMCPKKDGQIVVDFADEVVRGATIVKGHEITWPPPAPKLTAAPRQPAASKVENKAAHPAKAAPVRGNTGPIIAAVLGVAALFGVGAVAPPAFLAHFTVFVLACFVGYMVVWNVTPALHTPLMSVTNAISSIIIIGAILEISSSSPLVSWMAAVTVAVTSVNIAGGFAVTRRMLEMFRK
jgi:NAD(P) transhydrogenase subunit alpha